MGASLNALTGGHVRLLYTPLAHPEIYQTKPGFANFKDHFEKRGYPSADLNDGWAIVAHDAMFALITAIHLVEPYRTPGWV